MIFSLIIGLLAWCLGFDAGVDYGRKGRSTHTEDGE